MSESLYEIDLNLQLCLDEAMKEAEQNEGEVSELLAEKLDGIQQDKSAKIDNYCRYIKSLKAEIEMISNEQKILTKRNKTLSNKLEWLVGGLELSLKVGEKFSNGVNRVSWGRSCKVKTLNCDVVPDKYITNDPKLDKKAIKADIENDIDVPGVGLEYNNYIKVS